MAVEKKTRAEKIKENRDQYLEALRSGKYAQIIGHFKTEYGYCALGIAKQILDYPYDIKPSQIIETILGIDIIFKNRIIGWNDHDQLTFGQIADKIEAYNWGEPINQDTD